MHAHMHADLGNPKAVPVHSLTGRTSTFLEHSRWHVDVVITSCVALT